MSSPLPPVGARMRIRSDVQWCGRAIRGSTVEVIEHQAVGDETFLVVRSADPGLWLPDGGVAFQQHELEPAGAAP